MSDPEAESDRARQRTVDAFLAVNGLMLLGIAVLVGYSVRLGSLTSPGAQESFGYAIALMSLMAALLLHTVDRTYRSWPLGRRFSPTPPGPVTEESQVRLVKVIVVVLAAAAIAYLLGELLA